MATKNEKSSIWRWVLFVIALLAGGIIGSVLAGDEGAIIGSVIGLLVGDQIRRQVPKSRPRMK